MRGGRANNTQTVLYAKRGGWAQAMSLGLANSNIHRDPYPLFLINVAFNRQRGWIKEVEGRLGCYKLYIQLWLKGKMLYQLCAWHQGYESSFLYAVDLHQLLHQFWDLDGCNASSHTYQYSLLSHCCINLCWLSCSPLKVKVQIAWRHTQDGSSCSSERRAQRLSESRSAISAGGINL